jgi:hypothetical protein
MSSEIITTVNTKHDIGLVTAARLIAIFWAGLVPVVLPAWLILHSEMVSLNAEQDKMINRAYVTRVEFEDRMRLLDERAQRNTETLKEIRDEIKAQREAMDRFIQRGK